MDLSHLRRAARPWYALFFLITLLLTGGLIISACGPKQQSGTPTVTPTLTATATLPPTLTPTPEPPGSPSRPLVFALVSTNNDPQIAAAADEVAKQIAQRSGLAVTGAVYPDYVSLLGAMNRGEAHITWLPPLTYLYASQRSIVDVALLTNHFGVYESGTQFLANIESKFTPYFDPISGLSSAGPEVALKQFKGLRPCWVEPQSVWGYIVPAGYMAKNNLDFLPAVIAQNHTAIVRALYVKGICDFGATFSISGDPRTASSIQQDFPDVMNRIIVIWRTDAIIPNINLSYVTGLDEATRMALDNAFLDLLKAPQGKELLTLSAGRYQIDDLRPTKDDVYNPLRDLVKALDLDLQPMIGK